jgi:hypothetical protein
MIQEPLGFHNNITSGMGKIEYAFNPKDPKPFVITKKAQNLPDVHYDFDFTSKVVEQIATDEYVSQVRENFSNIGYNPKISRIVSVHSNGVKRGGFEKMTQTMSPVYTSAKQVGSPPTPFFTPMKGSPIKKEPRRNSIADIKISPKKEKSPTAGLEVKFDEGGSTGTITSSSLPLESFSMTEIVNAITPTPKPRRSERIKNQPKPKWR